MDRLTVPSLRPANSAVAAAARCGALLAATMLASTTAGAQATRAATPIGARVRVQDTVTRDTDAVGTLVRWHGDTIVLAVAGTPTSMRLRSWHRVDESLGRHTQIGRYGVLGGVGGALLGGIIASASVNPGRSRSDNCIPLGGQGTCWHVTTQGPSRSTAAAIGAGIGVLAGGVLGVVVGSIPQERWTPARGGVELAVDAAGGGAMLRVRVSRASHRLPVR